MRRATLGYQNQGSNHRAWSVCSVLGILLVACVTVVPADAFTRTVCKTCEFKIITDATTPFPMDEEEGELEELIVGPGTYVIEAGMVIRGFMLRSQSDNPADTIIAFEAGGIIADGRTAPTVIRGFTLDGGDAFGAVGSQGDVILRNMIIEGSTGPGVVGSTSFENTAGLVIIDSIIRFNKGGIRGGSGGVTLRNSEVSDNTGSGVTVNSGLLHIKDSVISGNTAIGGVPKGGGIRAYGTIILENVTVENNTAPASNRQGNPSLGGGMHINLVGDTPAKVTIRGGIFRGNSADRGGGINIEGLDLTSVFDGVTVTSNTAFDTGGGIFCNDREAPIEFALTSDVSGNSPDDVVGCETTREISWDVTGMALDLVVCKNKTTGQKVRLEGLGELIKVQPTGKCKDLGLAWEQGDNVQVKVVGSVMNTAAFGGIVTGIKANLLVCKIRSEEIFSRKVRIEDPSVSWNWRDLGLVITIANAIRDKVQCKAKGPAN